MFRNQSFPVELLKEWFLLHKRSLPWRENATPYRVWISEVMLQQTQVAVVIPYFERWMQLFPTIKALAEAPLTQVIKCWEGLGYYSRARYLHQAACELVEHFGGSLPEKEEELAKIKGIGPYTQAAIRSFAFKQKAAAVDGNVLRLLSRYLACEEEIEGTKTQKQLKHYAETILPDQEPWIVSEALIELGATVCMKRAQCTHCPLKSECLAFRHQLQESLPKRRARQQVTLLNRTVAVIKYNNYYLIQKGEEGKVMAGLYEFPYEERLLQGADEVRKVFEERLKLDLAYVRPLTIQKHSFTRYRAQLFPHLMEAAEEGESGMWRTMEELKSLPLSSGHRRIFHAFSG